MPDTKITALTAITTVDPAADVLPIVDISDTSMAASGTTKKITSNQILGAGGTATLASATISGALTIGGATSFPASVINTSGGNPVFTPTASTLFLYSGSSFLSIRNQANTQEIFNLTPAGVYTFGDGAGGTRMTLNSSGLGVGGSAAARIHAIDSGGVCGLFTRAAAPAAALSAAYITAPVSSGFSNSPVYGFWYQNTGISNPANETFAIRTNGAERFRVDDSGNVGIGVTPKPWRSGARALQLGANGYVSLHEQSNGNANLCFAAYEGSANVFNYTTTGDLPSRYVLVSGTHQWYTAPSGTAGNAITFTEVMRLDASGNLILLPSNTPPSLGTNGQLTVNATSNTNLRFSYRGSDGVTRVANITLA